MGSAEIRGISQKSLTNTSKWGTCKQTEVIEDYDMATDEQKLLAPYIEKVNGNLYVAKGDFNNAVKHYNKALLGLKFLFEMEEPIMDQPQAIKLIIEVEIMTCVNLAHAYIKLE